MREEEMEGECAQCLYSTLLQKEAENGQYLERAVTKKSFDFSKMGEIKHRFCQQRTKMQQRENW